MRIVPVTLADLAEYKALPIDLDFEDYVPGIFPELVATGGFYKAIDDDGRMMAVARAHGIAGRYAYLGSARTALPYRGRGIATAMARFLVDEMRRRGFSWAGLSTDDENVPVHKSMDRLGFGLLGVKAYVVLKAGGLPQFLRDNGIDVVTPTSAREVDDHGEKVELLREMLASARDVRHGDERVRILSHEPFAILPPNDDLAPLVAHEYRVRLVDGRPYILKTGASEGWDWAEATYYGGNVLAEPAVLSDMCAVAPQNMEFWLVLPRAVLPGIKRDSTEWGGVLRLYGAEL